MEVKPDWGCDGGLFLRSSEAGEAYQVTLDYLPGGGMGGIYGERLTGVGGPPPTSNTLTPEERAAARSRSSASATRRGRRRGSARSGTRCGPASRATCRTSQVWINGELVTDFTDTANHAAGRRHRRHDRDPDALQQRDDEALGARRLLALAHDRGQGAALTS